MSTSPSTTPTPLTIQERLAALQQQNRTLRSSLDQKDTVLESLQVAAKQQSRAAESEEEKITNVIMRRMDAFQAEQRKLAGSLKHEEKGKKILEEKLLRVTTDNAKLRGDMKHEEDEIVQRLKQQIAEMTDRKRDLEGRLHSENFVALQVSELRDVPGAGQADAESPDRFDASGTTPKDDAEEVEALLNESDVAAASPTVRNKHNRLASDTSMLSVLQREIGRLHLVQSDVTEQTQAYEESAKALAIKISAARADRERDRDKAEYVRGELDRTVSLTAELTANSEVLAEWATDKELFRCSSVASESMVSEGFGGERDSSVDSVRMTPTGEMYRPHVLHGRTPQAAPRQSSFTSKTKK